MTPFEAGAEHRWLQQLLGEWTFEHEVNMGAGQPAMTVTGKESVRALGGAWIVLESGVIAPEGTTVSNATNIMSLGYDPAKKRYVGTFISYMIPNLWVYDGELQGNVLTLDTVGPSVTNPDASANYKDVIELVNPNLRTLTSHVQGDDGEWTLFMTATYRRTV